MADYSFDVQKLYLEMFLADAESFARASNIFTPRSFDRKLQPIAKFIKDYVEEYKVCLLYTSPSPRDKRQSRMPSSA